MVYCETTELLRMSVNLVVSNTPVTSALIKPDQYLLNLASLSFSLALRKLEMPRSRMIPV